MNFLLRTLKALLPLILILWIFFSLPNVCAHSHDHGHGHSHDHGHGHSHDHGHAHSHDHGHAHEDPSFKWSQKANEPYMDDEPSSQTPKTPSPAEEHSKPPGNKNLWIEALGSTLMISIAPYLILYFIPVTNTKEHEPYLKILLAFASGGLLGDAFLHLIPHALMSIQSDSYSHSHSHSHSHESTEDGQHSHDNTVGVSVLAGIIVFLIVEKFVRIFKGDHAHSHSHAAQNGMEVSNKNTAEKNKKNKTKEHSKKGKKNDASTMKVAGYLNLAADFTHNLTDGLAIGASFLAGRSVGIVTTFTIFLHEIPHEIGDFAILIQSGCSKKKAMLLQLVTAFGAITGTCISLLAEGADDSAVSWILPFTAGGFIYIATVSVIPELLENSHFWQSLCEVTALLLGVALMMGITWLEEMEHHT